MDAANRRGFFRAKIIFPVRWRVLSPEEARAARQGMGQTLFRRSGVPDPIDEFIEQATPGSKEEQLYRCLQLINNKIDFVIEQTFLHPSETPPSRGTVVDLSGSGIKLNCREHLKQGTLLKMDLLLPGTFQYQVELVSEVVWVEAMEDGYVTGCRIIDIEESARESIVKVVFQKQRRDIRHGKLNQEDPNAV
jgi:hypothetical protein